MFLIHSPTYLPSVREDDKSAVDLEELVDGGVRMKDSEDKIDYGLSSVYG